MLNRDDLRRLKKSLEESQVENKTTKIDDPFRNYWYDISRENIQPIETMHIYKKTFKAKHVYESKEISCDKVMSTPAYKPRADDRFKELSIFLPVLFEDVPIVDSDFLTGFYFGKTIIYPYILGLKKQTLIPTISSFHSGMSSDGMIRGIWYALENVRSTLGKSIKWNFLGCDNKLISKYKTKYILGISKKCNIFDINSVKSISIQLNETSINFDFYIADVKPNNISQLLTELLLVNYTKFKFIILRLPLNWLSCYTQMINVLLYFISSFQVVKIFKTPWSIIPKIYVYLETYKLNAFTTPRTLSLENYIKEYTSDTSINLYNKMIFNIEQSDTLEIKKSTDVIINDTQKAYIDVMSYDEIATCEESNSIFTDNLIN
jgi:hypothetical protein